MVRGDWIAVGNRLNVDEWKSGREGFVQKLKHCIGDEGVTGQTGIVPIQLIEAAEEIDTQPIVPNDDSLLGNLVEEVVQVEDQGAVFLCQGVQLRVQRLNTVTDLISHGCRDDGPGRQGAKISGEQLASHVDEAADSDPIAVFQVISLDDHRRGHLQIPRSRFDR